MTTLFVCQPTACASDPSLRRSFTALRSVASILFIFQTAFWGFPASLLNRFFLSCFLTCIHAVSKFCGLVGIDQSACLTDLIKFYQVVRTGFSYAVSRNACRLFNYILHVLCCKT